MLLFHVATLKALVESPGALSIISSSQRMLLSAASWEVASGHFTFSSMHIQDEMSLANCCSRVKLASMKEPIYTAHHSPATWSLVVIDACLMVYGVCLSAVSSRATSVYFCRYLDCTVYGLCVLGGGPVSSAGTPESPVQRAVSHVVKTMSGEVPRQQTEQGEPTRGVAQPHLKEERCVGWGIAHAYLPSLVYSNTQM